MFNIGSQELVVILFVVLMLFGAKRIPEVARSVGSGMREFRKAMRGIEDELRFDDDRRPPSRFEPRRSEPPGASRTAGTSTLSAGTTATGGVTGQTNGAPADSAPNSAAATTAAPAANSPSAGQAGQSAESLGSTAPHHEGPGNGGSSKESEERAS
jgi:TatA/E family protein of Tat protein translocase